MDKLHVRLKRAYEPAAPGDGYRVLIDRLWPRGLSRQELRRWFGHEPARFDRARNGALTLVYSARDTKHNDAVVLAEVLRRGLPTSRR
jgi:uncharacterized protein YeaO (DUF488 family)